MGWYFQRAERKNNVSKKILNPAKLYFKNEGEIDLPRQTKTEGFLYHQMCLTRYAKGSSLI